MAWVKLDDGFFNNQKIVSVSKDARAMYIAGLFHTSSTGGDGYILSGDVRKVAKSAGVRYFNLAVSRLLDDGLWIPYEGGYGVLDWGFIAKRVSERLPAHEWALIRSQVFQRDEFTCTYCGTRGGTLECDHIIPVSRGGSNFLDNLATACFTCNRSKRDKTVEEWLG